jgi:hypothetical protein
MCGRGRRLTLPAEEAVAAASTSGGGVVRGAAVSCGRQPAGGQKEKGQAAREMTRAADGRRGRMAQQRDGRQRRSKFWEPAGVKFLLARFWSLEVFLVI